jgi:hypothetical protein
MRSCDSHAHDRHRWIAIASSPAHRNRSAMIATRDDRSRIDAIIRDRGGAPSRRKIGAAAPESATRGENALVGRLRPVARAGERKIFAVRDRGGRPRSERRASIRNGGPFSRAAV